MADVDLREASVAGRDIRYTDVIAAFDPTESDASLSARVDTLLELVRKVYARPPDDLTEDETEALRTALVIPPPVPGPRGAASTVPGPRGPRGLKGPEGPAGIDETARASIATEITAREEAGRAEAITRDAEDDALGLRVTNEASARIERDTFLDAAVTAADVKAAAARVVADTAVLSSTANATELAAVKVLADAAQTAAEVDADVSVENEARIAGDNTEKLARESEDTALGIRVDEEATARKIADIALDARITALPAGGGGGGGAAETDLFSANVVLASSNLYVALDDTVDVPSAGFLRFTVYGEAFAYSGDFLILASEFVSKTGSVATMGGQYADNGFAISVGQNRYVKLSSRVVAGKRRFLFGAQDAGTWVVSITSIPAGSPAGGGTDATARAAAAAAQATADAAQTAAEVDADVLVETTARIAADTALGARITALPGPSGAPTRALYVGWSAAKAITVVALSTSSDSHQLAVPAAVGNMYFGIWRADVDGGDPAEVYLSGGGSNIRPVFGAATNVAIAFAGTPVSGKLIVTEVKQSAPLWSGQTLRVG